MLRFFSLRIADRKEETPSAVSFAFDVPMRWRQHFRFSAGQYLTLRAPIAGREVRRAYSICSAAQSGELRIAVKRVEEGAFSNYACDNFVAGQIIDVMPPHGHFTAPLACPGVHYVGCAAGSGITPIFSIVKSVLAADTQSRFTLFYGNRTVKDSLFHDKLQDLAALFGDRLQVIRSFSRQAAEMPDHTGRIDAVLPDLIEKHIGNRMAATQWFVCGPNPMMSAVKEILMRNPIQPAAILMESFNAPNGTETLPDGVLLNALVSAKLFGQAREFHPGAATISDGAIAAGFELPYSCRTGVCAMCKARVLAGQAYMPADTILSQGEIADGFILTCRAYAMSETVTIDCDID